jgi:hypothetical protein
MCTAPLIGSVGKITNHRPAEFSKRYDRPQQNQKNKATPSNARRHGFLRTGGRSRTRPDPMDKIAEIQLTKQMHST